jgi:tetratricopeptide (TPR) repeat protein
MAAVSLLQAPGDLSRTPLAAILLEALNSRATGILSVEHGGGQSRVFIRNGRPAGAQVATGFRPLGHVLLQAGVIDIDALSRSLAEMATTRRPQGEILVEMGAVSREIVERHLAEQQTGYVTLIASLDSGGYKFDAVAVPDWTRSSQLPTLRIIVEAMERPQAGALVVSALQPVAAGTVQLAPGYAEVADQFGWTAVERGMIERLARPAPLDTFFATADVAPERARAIIGSLLLLGLAGTPGELQDASAGLKADAVGGATSTAIPAVVAAGRAGPPPAAPTAPTAAAPAAAAPAQPAAPDLAARRSDPAEARARRQRLLQRAMQNMGVGPFGGARPGDPQPTAPAPAPAAAPPQAAPAAQAAPGSPEDRLRRALLEIAPRAKDKNLFMRLGLDPGAGREVVKKAYLDLAKQFHPDRFASPVFEDVRDTVRDFFTSVNEAYETLSDDRKRADYLATLRAVGSGNPATSMAAANAQIDFEKGEACVRTRDFAKARAFLEAAVRASPVAKFQAALAWAYLADPAVKDKERARELVAQARQDPSCDRAFYISGVLARDEGNDAAAEKHFNAALKANPRHAEAVRELRAIELRRKKR